MNTDINLLGLDIGGTQVRVALAKGHQIIANEATTWPSNLSPIDEVHFVADFALKLVRRTNVAEPVSVAGVSLAAQIDHNGTVIQWPNRPAWRGLAFQSLLESWLGIPTIVDDDANAAALAEWTFGAAQGYRYALIMMVGTGVGAGLILDGRLFHGRNGWAGELGHMVVLQDGPPCPCGHQGCLQMVASGRALERLAAERGLSGASDITTAAERGEAWAYQALESCGRWLGLAASNIVNILDLEAAVIGGGLSTLEAPLWPTLTETFQANLLNQTYRRVALHRTALPNTAGVLGAVSMAWQLVGSGKVDLKKKEYE